MVHYKLIYFNGKGAGESIRQIFALAGQEFEDVRIEHEDWPNHKDKMPFGQMPVLEVDGKQLPQSFAIARYVARTFGVAGKTPWEEAQVDALADQYKDFVNKIVPFLGVFLGFKEGDLPKLRAEVFVPAVNENFAFFNNAVKNNPSGFLVGSSVTWIDLLLAEFTAMLIQKDPEVLDAFKEIREHCAKIHSIDRIKKWRDNRPDTKF